MVHGCGMAKRERLCWIAELCHERGDEGGCLFEVFTVDVVEGGEVGAVDVYLAYYDAVGE